MNMNIKTKLTYGIGLLFVLITLLGGLAIKNIHNVSDDTQNILADNYNSDMSKRGITEQTMLAPDNRKSQLSIDELQSLIQQLPETSDEVKEMIRMMNKEKALKSKK